MLVSEAGHLVTIADREYLVTDPRAAALALFGPYSQMAPGRYRVTFRLGVADRRECDEDEICAVIDVTADSGWREIAVDRVLLSDLSANGSVSLDFDISEPLKACEYRVWTTGKVALVIADQPVLTMRDDDRPGFSRLAAVASSDSRMIVDLWKSGAGIDVRDGRIMIGIEHLPAIRRRLMATEDRQDLAETIVASAGYRGVDENSLFRAFVGTDKPPRTAPQPIPLTSSLCHQTHFGYEQYRFWLHALKEKPRYQRKQWEFFFIAQALFERGLLTSGRTGLVFGAGEEQLPALFASFGVKVVATDQAIEDAKQSGWASSGQYSYDISALNKRNICTDRMFSELVSFMPVDMNNIPPDLSERFDFCWSACALEHLGSLKHGFDFIRSSMHTLRPGGIAVHTTEFNLSSNEETLETEGLSLYRRRDIEAIVKDLESDGNRVLPIDWELGEGFAEMVVDVAPHLGRGEPHIRLKIGQYDSTSIGMIIEKPSAAK